jgi:hypothetical protein
MILAFWALGYDVIPDFAIEITEFYANHCTVGTHGETIDAPTGAPHVFRKHPQHKRLADFKRF